MKKKSGERNGEKNGSSHWKWIRDWNWKTNLKIKQKR